MTRPEPTGNDAASQELATLQPFRLVKFFSFTALAMTLVAAMVLSWVISNNAKQVLLDRSEAYALLLAENLNNQVFVQFVVPTAIRYGEIALSNPEQFKRLDTVVRNTTHGFKVDSVTIYDSNENIISYSTIPELVGQEDVGGVEYLKAKQGESNSSLISTGSLLNLLPGGDQVICKLKTYIPFIRESEGGKELIIGVTEIVQDLSDDLLAIIKLQATIMTSSLVIMGGLFAMLRLLVSRADQIIAARAEERRRLEIKLNDAERLAGLGKMITAVSHEIKNPLGIVRSTAEVLDRRLKKIAPENQHLSEIIIEETSRLDGVVMEFLDFARPQRPEIKTVQINELLDKVLVFMRPDFKKHKINVEQDLAGDLPEIMADQNQLHRALLNILVNAVQAMPDGGTLRVRTTTDTEQPGRICIAIEDNGKGISEEKVKKIFQPFYTEKARGTGLGLAIVKNIVDSHQGELRVESTPEEGTTFTLILPGDVGQVRQKKG